MKYIKVKWVHNYADEPVWLYSELDESREETRKVELYLNGKFGFAGTGEAHGKSQLSELSLPSNAQISSDPQFEVSDIDKIEFDNMWEKAKKAFEKEQN